MEHLDYFILDLTLILTVAGIITLIFKKIRQPVVLGYIVAGFLISPNFMWLPTVVESENIHTWAEIGIVFLMFALGLEFSFKKIAKIGGSAIITALTVMGAMICVGFISGKALGWNTMDSVFLGGMISMSSTMIILKSYEEYKLKKEKFAALVLGTLVLEDLGGIFMMIILSTVSVSRSLSGMALMGKLGLLLAVLVIWMAIGIFLIPTFLKKISGFANDEMLVIISIAICLCMVMIASMAGFSSALGAFMAGSIIAGTVMGERIERLIKPIKDLFGAIFFVSVGMLVEPEMLAKYIGPVIIITVVTVIGQMLFSTIGMLVSGQSLHTAVRGGSSMNQVGEFSFIIASLGITLGVTSDFLYPIIVCVSVITCFTTPVFIKNSQRTYLFLRRHLPKSTISFLDKYTYEHRSSKDSDSDWQSYLKKYFFRVGLCSGGLLCLYFLGKNFLMEFAQRYVEGFWGNMISAGIVSLFMIPVISLMCSKKNIIYTKLWIKNISNRFPLIALNSMRILLALFFIVLTWRRFAGMPYWVIIILALVLVAFSIQSDFMKGTAIKMETRFVENFSEKTLAKQKKERKVSSDYHWLDEKLFIVEFDIKSTVPNNSIAEFGNSRYYEVTIVKIVRNGKHINMPGPDEKVLEGDVIHALGTKGEIETCILMLEKEEHINEPKEPIVTLKEYIYGQIFHKITVENQIFCCPIVADKDSGFVRKSIKNSGFRKRFKGNIIGVERRDLPIINPDINLVIEESDLLWVLGSQRMADRLIKAGFLDDLQKR